MTFVVTDNCIKCKYMDCVEVCPVDCFYEGENMLVIHPDECIDCGVCEPECPAEAIFPDTRPGPRELAQTECGVCVGLAEHHDQARAACGCEGIRWRRQTSSISIFRRIPGREIEETRCQLRSVGMTLRDACSILRRPPPAFGSQ